MVIAGCVIIEISRGGLTVVLTFIASDLILLRKRGLWQGIANICWGLGSGIGGLFGRFINNV